MASCATLPENDDSIEQAKLTKTVFFQNALLTATYAVVNTHSTLESRTPIPTVITRTEIPTRDPQATPPPLPELFTSQKLKDGVTPQNYINDTCKYIKLKWDANNSPPGTVVMPIMYHSITGDYNEVSPDGSQIRQGEHENIIRHAREVGFETITTEELVNFLENNAKIPERSLLLIIDDRRPGQVRVNFMPFLQEYNWTVTLGWIIGDTDTRAATFLEDYPGETFSSLWDQMEAYYATGLLDIQAHGYIHNIPITEKSSDEFIRHEIVDSRSILQKHFYCKDPATKQPVPDCNTRQPLAYIWPGGGFSKRAAEIAREAGYHVGFTTNPRGPIMFNWIPQASEVDPKSPYWIPEIPANDPMMTLPRYWSNDAAYKIDEVISIGKEAARYAEQNKQTELDYYKVMCVDKTGEILLDAEK